MAENLAERTRSLPGFDNGVLYLYEGDTFDLRLELNIMRDEEPITIDPSDVVLLEFRNEKCETKKVMASVEFTDIVDNEVVLHWDDELTSKFKRGRYTYRMKYNSEYVTTLVADNIIVVL